MESRCRAIIVFYKERYIDQQIDIWTAKAHCQRVERLKCRMQAGIPERPYLRNDANRQKLGTDRRRLAHRPSCRSPPRSTTGRVLIAAIHERTNGTHNITWQLARPLRHGPWHVTVPDGIAGSARVQAHRFCHSSFSTYGMIFLPSFN